MNSVRNIAQQTLVFSRWTRKAYAIFTSIGKIIKIGCLKIEVFALSNLKSVSFDVQEENIETGNKSSSTDDESENPKIQELILQLLSTTQVTPQSGGSCGLGILSKIVLAFAGTLFQKYISTPTSISSRGILSLCNSSDAIHSCPGIGNSHHKFYQNHNQSFKYSFSL